MSVQAGRVPSGIGLLDGDDVTRYLCAGAYLDSVFAWDVVDEVLLNHTRAVAPAPGTDIATVTRHSLSALRRAARRDVVLTSIVLAVAALAGFQGLLIAVWLFSWALAARALRSLGRGELGGAFAQFGVFLLISVGCLLALVLRSDQPLLGAGGVSVRVPLQSTQVLGVVIAGLWIVNYLDRVSNYGVLAESLSRFSFSPSQAPAESERWRDRLAYITASAGSRLSVCSQDAPNAPFSGFGPVVHAWSVSSQLESAGPSGPSQPLSALEIYARMLADGAEAGFAVSEIVLTPGWLPPGHPFFDAAHERPVPGIPPAIVQDIAAHPGGSAAYHLVWSSVSGTGLSAHGFIQAAVREGQLALDVALTVLPPVDARYRAADLIGEAGLTTMARMLGAAFLDVGRRTPQAPVNLVRSSARLWSRRAENGRGTRHSATGSGRDHGARAGVREIAARRAGATAVNDYEATRQVNLLSREITSAVSGLLSQRGFDPAPFMRAADPVWQKPLTSPSGRGPEVRVS